MLLYIKRCCYVLVGLCTLAVVAYLVLGHPNDARLKSTDLSKLEVKLDRYQKSSCMFYDKWPLSLSISEENYQKNLQQLVANYKNHITTKSLRFDSTWETFVTVGSHPEYLEGRHAFLIPQGESAKITLPSISEGDKLHFGMTHLSTRPSSLKIEGASLLWEKTLPAFAPVRDSNGFWYKNALRYLFPDSEVPGGYWTNEMLSLTKTEDRDITVSCVSSDPKGWCVFSEFSYYQETSGVVSAPKKNVVMILVDTLRADGINQESAPFLTQLQSESLHFSKAIAPGNMTTPSTNGILSCLNPSQFGDIAFSYASTPEMLENHYKTAKPSFASFFTQNGWKTGMIGNISVISDIMGIALDHGFEEQIAIEQSGYDTPNITKKALQWVQENQDRPFFLYLHYHAPHAPYRAPFKDIFATKPDFGQINGLNGILRWLYAAEVHYTDRYIEELINGLKLLGLKDKTIIALTADHGDQHAVITLNDNDAGPAYSGSYFDHGATLLNDEIHVPLFFVMPSDLEKKETITDYVSGLDIGPTLLKMNGLDIPPWCTGKDLQDLQLDSAKRIVGTEGFRQRGLIWGNRYKYIRTYEVTEKRFYPPTGWSAIPTQVFINEQLFDLQNDPTESKNLVKDKSLLTQGRMEFKKYYNIKESLELVIDNPNQEPILVNLDQVPMYFKIQKRITIPISESQLSSLSVRMSGKRKKPKLSSLRLALSLPEIGLLPTEFGLKGDLLPVSKFQDVYLRKVEVGDLKTRVLITGNDRFQKILRDWGYLNDNK